MHQTLHEPQINKHYITQLYEGTTLNDNLRKHADAPKIPSTKHPHHRYRKCDRIILKMLDPELINLEQIYNPKDENGHSLNPEWFNDLKLDDITCDCPHKTKFEKLFDKTSPADEVMCWTACRHTTLAAAKRQMKAAPTPNEDVAADFINHSMDIINKEMGFALTEFGYSVEDWFNHLDSTKQYALRHVINYYKGDTTSIPKKELKNITNLHYTGILKEELQPPDGKPRMVCSIPQRTKYIMGPITWALEEIAQETLQGYCGGQNLDQMTHKINQYLQQGFTQIYEGDGSAFDNTQDVSLKQIDRNIYSMIEHAIYHVPVKDFHKVSQSLYKTMDIEYIEGTKKKPLLRYRILGTVFSGDCDTTLMNTIRMVLYNRYVNDKAGLKFGEDYVCFSKGDDFTLMYKPYVTKEFIHKAYYKYFLNSVPDPSNPNASIYGLGQVLKFLEGGDASTIKFCSLRAWFTDASETQIYLTRDVAKFLTLSKYSRKTKSKTLMEKIIYLRDIATSLRKSYAKIKYFENLAGYYEQLADRIQHDTHLTTSYIEKFKEKQQRKQNNKIKAQNYDVKYIHKLEQDNKDQVKHRKFQYKIIGQYWDYMKTLLKQHTETLDDKTAEYISKQIELEIGEEIIKSMYDVGPYEKY